MFNLTKEQHQTLEYFICGHHDFTYQEYYKNEYVGTKWGSNITTYDSTCQLMTWANDMIRLQHKLGVGPMAKDVKVSYSTTGYGIPDFKKNITSTHFSLINSITNK